MQKKEIFRLKFSNSDVIPDAAAHSEIELLYLLDGTVDIQVEQKLTHMKKDDILVINPDRRRSFQYVENPLMMHLMIDYEMVRESFQNQDVLYWCDSTTAEHEKYNDLRKLLKRLVRRYIQSENYDTTFSFLSDCYNILAYLSFDFLVKAADVQWSEEGDRFEERLFKINNYINSNYDQPISIKDLSEKLFLSIGYLSRFFKKNYGMNFANYLTNVRLVHATDELLYTNISVTRVAYDCGFTSAAIFNKAFKKAYNITPTEFRKQAGGGEKKQIDFLAKKDLEAQIGQIVENNHYIDGTDEENERIKTLEATFSSSEKLHFENYWGDTINFGEASNLLSSPIRNHLITLRERLKFRYVRFWSIFSRDFFIRPDQEDYDFSQIDSVLDFVLEQGMLPFIDLGMKPKTLAFEIGQINKEYVGEEFSNEQWERTMKRFLRHIEKRYGKKALDKWRMELWFEEDQRNSREAWEKYLEKFRITYQIVKECSENIQLGGYGIRMDSGGEERLEFLKKWVSSYPLPDFISIMFYAYERGADGMDIHARRSTDDEVFIRFLRNEKERLKKAGMGHLPVYICEWNMTPSVRNYINDTCYKGAYIIRNIIDVFGEVQSMGYGAGSDRQYSSYDTTDRMFGGTGLITKEGIRKPAAFALEFMNRLSTGCIGKDKNYIITSDGDNNFNIVCHNQQKLNESYYLTPETKIQRDALWKYFDNTFKLKLKINLTDIPEGKYKINIYRVNQEYGSILDIWVNNNFENELQKDEIEYFKKICEPFITINRIQPVNGILKLDEELEPNEFALITVRYID